MVSSILQTDHVYMQVFSALNERINLEGQVCETQFDSTILQDALLTMLLHTDHKSRDTLYMQRILYI